MGFLGFANVYAMRVNLSVAIVAMVNNTAFPLPVTNNSFDHCSVPNVTNATTPNVRKFIYLLVHFTEKMCWHSLVK